VGNKKAKRLEKRLTESEKKAKATSVAIDGVTTKIAACADSVREMSLMATYHKLLERYDRQGNEEKAAEILEKLERLTDSTLAALEGKPPAVETIEKGSGGNQSDEVSAAVSKEDVPPDSGTGNPMEDTDTSDEE
jgi:glutamate synthase domain-containing protein 3